jgi:hypothetical protein
MRAHSFLSHFQQQLLELLGGGLRGVVTLSPEASILPQPFTQAIVLAESQEGLC